MVEKSAESTMGLNIKNAEVERLAEEISRLAGETKTEAIRKALAERKLRLRARIGAGRGKNLRQYLEREVWAHIPSSRLGKTISREERESILGYGPGGY